MINRRKLFGLLAALPVAGAAIAKGLKTAAPRFFEVYQPPMREVGQWGMGSLFYESDDSPPIVSYCPDQYFVRHDTTFVDQHGEHHQWGVDHSFPEEPTEEQLIEARKKTREVFKRLEHPTPAYVSEKYGYSSPARPATWPVGPSSKFNLGLPRAIKHARWV